MNATLKLLALIADGKARTNEQLREESGLTARQIGDIVSEMRGRRFMRFAPVRYEITDAGLERVTRALAKAQRIAKVEAEKERRIALRAAAKMKPLGRPRMTAEERKATAEARNLAKKQQRIAARLALEAGRAARRAAAKEQEELARDAELAFVHSIVEAGAAPDPMIQQTLRMQPALQSAWGAMA